MRLSPNDLSTTKNDYDPNAIDELLSKEIFYAMRSQILPWLRAKGDPSPTTLRFGSGTGSPAENLKAELFRAPIGARIVRGFRMMMVPLDECFMWKAYFDPVVAYPLRVGARLDCVASKGGGVRVKLNLIANESSSYVSVTAPRNDAFKKEQYIFVPSSRAHRELSDVELLRDEHYYCTVVGGNTIYVNGIIKNYRTLGRASCVIGHTPEECVAVPRVRITYFPYFKEWMREEWPARDEATIAEMMGFPLKIHMSEDGLCDSHAVTLDHALLSDVDLEDVVSTFTNQHCMKMIDPTMTYALRRRCLELQMAGRIRMEDERDMFRRHYRAQMHRLNARLVHESEVVTSELGLDASLNPVA